MATYYGYTAKEVQEMEAEGTCPDHVLVAYINNEYDGSDE